MNVTPEITLYGNTWCGGSRRARLFFDQHHIPYRWVDIDGDEDAAKYIESLNHGNRSPRLSGRTAPFWWNLLVMRLLKS